MRVRPFLLFSVLALIATVVPASAGSDAMPYNRVHFSESAQTEIENDLLVAVMTAQAEGRDAAGPADNVNRQMDWAVSVASSVAGIKTQTLGYSSHPVYEKSKIRGWRVSQSLRLESSDDRELGDLIARLQEQLRVQSIAYRISDEQRRRHLDDLTDTALARFRTRAKAIAQAMGRGDYRVVKIHINDGQRAPMPMARGAMLEAASADMGVAPARIEAGTQTLSVSISAEIELAED